MPGPRQPTALVIANGKKHLTKSEIKERMSSEVQPCTDDITAPSFLTAKQRTEFVRIAGQLQKLKIMGETDCDALARYVVAQENYERVVKDLRAVQKQRPKGEEATVETTVAWAEMLEKLDKRLERYSKQARVCAADLGLTITSRVKLVVPVKDEQPKVNKFAQFGGVKRDGGESVYGQTH